MPKSNAPSPHELSSRIAVVVNGNAKSVTAEIIQTLDEILEGGDLFVSRHVEESEGIARTLVDRGYGTVLTGGGDGTFTVMVTAVVREARARQAPVPRFGLLRLGTGNSLAWVLGASGAGVKMQGRGARHALSADIARLRAEAGSRSIRLIEVDGMLSPFCGFGIDAIALRDYGRVKALLAKTPLRPFASGLFAYAISATTRTGPGYVFRKTARCRVINEGSDAVRLGKKGVVLGAPVPRGQVLYEGPAKLASVSTIPYYGFGFRVFPYADEREDRMTLRITTISPFTFAAHLPAIWRGEYDDPETLFDFLADDLTLEMEPATPFQIGGDERGSRTRVRVRLAEPIRMVDFYAPPRG